MGAFGYGMVSLYKDTNKQAGRVDPYRPSSINPPPERVFAQRALSPTNSPTYHVRYGQVREALHVQAEPDIEALLRLCSSSRSWPVNLVKQCTHRLLISPG